MKLEIKSLDSADTFDLENWQPASREDVYLQLSLGIGELGAEEFHLFQVMITTPESVRWRRRHDSRPHATCKELVIDSEYSWQAVIDRLNEIVTSCEEDCFAFDHCCDKLRQYFSWEFEGYR